MAKERKNFSILIVEDDDGHYLLITKNLRRLGFSSRVIRFVDGQQVLDFLDTHANEQEKTNYLMLLDISLPRMTGIRVLSRVRQDDRFKTIPIVMLTASDDAHEKYTCKALGCDDYIVKPPNAAGFAEAINRAVDTFLVAIMTISEFDD